MNMRKNILGIVILYVGLLGGQPSEDMYRQVAITIPKCGTNLLFKLLTGICSAQLAIPRKRFFLIDDQAVKILTKSPLFILIAHAIYVERNIKKLNDEHIKKVFIYRDPRDQIVSAAFWIKTIERVPEHEWSIDELIDALILDGSTLWSSIFLAQNPWIHVKDIASFYNLYLPWRFEPNVYTTTFEKLVGKEGGGDEATQIDEIIAIANYLGHVITTEEAKKISSALFGGTLTFREGKIGSWKGHFLERHKAAFKKVAGQLLIDLGYERDFNW
jgi:hypothetical protein